MPTVLHLADLHLGWRPFALPPERARARQERRDALLREAVDLALVEAVDLVVIAGDLFDRHAPDPVLLESCLDELGRLVGAGIPLVTVPGVHDEITYPTGVFRARGDSWPGVLVRGEEPAHVATFEREGAPIHVYAMAWSGGPSRVVDSFPRRGVDGIHLGLFHGRLGAIPGVERGPVLDPEALGRAGYDYVALGGVHRRERILLGETVAAYPGLVDALDFDEPGAGAWTLARVEPGCVEVMSRPFSGQPVFGVTLDVTGLEEPEIVARIQRLGNPQALVRVTLEGTAGGRLDVLRIAASGADGFFHLELVDATTSLEAGQIALLSSELTILGHFVRRMQARIDGASTERERRVLERALRRGVETLQAEMAP